MEEDRKLAKLVRSSPMNDDLSKWLNLGINNGLVGEQLIADNKHFTIQKNGYNLFTLLGDFNKKTPFKNCLL